jgi:hypothetical protein
VLASWAILELLLLSMIFGIVILVDFQSNISASHCVLLVLFSALDAMDTSHLYVEIHPSLDIDFDTIFEVVFFHICITFDQTS